MKAERFFADTNLFPRYLATDVPEQAGAVETLYHRAAKGEFELVTNTLGIAEIVWTLESYYALSRPEIQQRVLAILNTPGLEIAEREILNRAILWYGEKNVDFIDACNAAWMSSQGIASVYTVNQKHLGRLEGITVHIPGEVRQLSSEQEAGGNV